MPQKRNLELGRIVKFCISAAAFFGFCVIRSVSGLFGIHRPPKCMVLYYHSVPAEFRKHFANQLDTVLRYTEPAHPLRREPLESGKTYSVVTFDDGFTNFIDTALPELVSRKIPSLMFIITKALGKSFGPANAPEKVMSLEQLRILPQSLVVLGSHTLTHPFLPDLNEAESRRELFESRITLETLLGRPVPFFSFPYGGMTPELVSACRLAGYSRVFSTLPVATGFSPSEYCIGRVRVDPWDWPMEFRLKLAGAYNWLPTAISFKRALLGNSLIFLFKRRKSISSSNQEWRSFIHS